MKTPNSKRTITAWLSLPLAVLPVLGWSASAPGADLSEAEQKIIGAWQDGMTPRMATLPAARIAQYRKIGLLGNIVRYQADHTYVAYPRCPRLAEWTKAGHPSIAGTWKFNEAGELVIHTAIDGKEIDQTVLVSWNGDQMVSTIKGQPRGIEAGRYTGELPQPCP